MTAAMHSKARILTGDTPTSTGLHLGHYVGSLENRLALQDEYDCYFLIANVHAFTTLAEKPQEVRANTIGIVKDWLAVGLDPERSTFVLQSEIPAIAELTFLFAMLLPFNKVMRNPTLKTEIETDGGIRRQTVPLIHAAGSDLIVPGSLMFGEDPKTMRQWLASL